MNKWEFLTEQWYSGTVVQWYSGTVVQWYSGTVVQWYSGTVVQWYSGAVVQWYTFLTQVLEHLSKAVAYTSQFFSVEKTLIIIKLFKLFHPKFSFFTFSHLPGTTI